MSAWTRIVRGPESESDSVANVTQSSTVENSGDNAGGKKPAWSKNPAPESSAVVMSADLWPPLSESTKKLSPSSSSTDLGSAQKPATGKANHSVTPTPSHGQPARQNPVRRGNAQANGSSTHQNSLPKHNIPVKPTELGARNPNGDHHHPHSSLGRGNGGTQQNYRGRRDLYHQRGFNGSHAPLQHRVDPRGYVRPPPVPAPYGPPMPHMRPPFMNPTVMPDMSMFYFHQGVPYVAPPPPPSPPVFVPVPELQLRANIVIQIDYYFSDANLVKDTYLREKMDKDGWVPITLIASFDKVKKLTNNIELILNVLHTNSSLVEVKDYKIRRRGDYKRWIILSIMEFSTTQPPHFNGGSQAINVGVGVSLS